MRVSLFVVVVMVSAACSSSSDEPSTSGRADSASSDEHVVDGETGLTGLTAELAALREANDGRLPLSEALNFFASALGEIPGGDPTRFESRVGDATMALQEVGAHWEELTSEQQQAVQTALGYPKSQSLVARAASPDDVALQELIDSARTEIASSVGSDVSFPITGNMVPGLTAVLPGDTERSPVGGVTWPERGGMAVFSGRADRCRISFNSNFVVTETTVAHEVFHCFQFALAPDISTTYAAQRWVIEGSAEWAGAKIGGVDSLAERHFIEWLTNSGSMYGLDYAAIGYYWVLESMGVSPWIVVQDMLATSGVGAVAASGLNPSDVLSRVATSAARRQVPPSIPVTAIWDFSTADVPERGTRRSETVTPDTPIEIPFARADFARTPIGVFTLEGGERVQVAIDSDVGTLEFFGKEAIEWAGQLHQEFCLEEGGCRCGLDGAVDSGLTQGSRTVIAGGAELEAGEAKFDIRIPDSTAFTDGHWQGDLTYTVVGIVADGTVGTLSQSVGAIELTVADGAVTGGGYELGIPGQFDRTGGAHAEGVYTTVATFDGCGFSPQVARNDVGFTGNITVGDTNVPFNFDLGFSAADGSGTLWRIDPPTDPNRRTGEIDTIADQVVRNATGWTITDVTWTFEMSLGS